MALWPASPVQMRFFYPFLEVLDRENVSTTDLGHPSLLEVMHLPGR